MPHKDIEVKKQYFKDYYKRNKDKLNSYRTLYKEENKDKEDLWQSTYRVKSIENRKRYIVKSRYDLTLEDINDKLIEQDNRCACCGNEFIKTPHIDHCHTTNNLRGLLCGPCNTGLGVYEKKKELFERYLDGRIWTPASHSRRNA